MILFTAGGALYETFATRYPCEKRSLRAVGPVALAGSLDAGDVVIHNAANLNPVSLDAGIQDNFILTRELVQAVIAAGVDVRFIFISSMSMLGPGGVYKDPLEMNAYSFSKYLAEIYCLKSPLPAFSVRFSTLFYKDPARDGLSKMITGAKSTGALSLLNGGRDTRDFIPLETAVDYLYKIATLPGQPDRSLSGTAASIHPGVLTIGSGITVSFAELAEMIKTALPATTIGSIDSAGTAPFVLSRFETADIDKLGRIKVDLPAQIQDYINTLS